MIVERIRASIKGNREELVDGMTFEQRIRADSDSFHVIDEDDEEALIRDTITPVSSEVSNGVLIGR